MKQFTYKGFDIITEIVFTNLCCDILNRFDIDMFNDASAKPIFEALANYIGNNVKIKEEYHFEYNEYINLTCASVVNLIGENNVNFIIDEYKKGGCDYALDLLCDSLDKDENEISYSMRQALVIEAMNYMLEKQKFETKKVE